MQRVKKAGSQIMRGIAILIVALLFVLLFALFVNGLTFYEDAAFLYSFAGKPELAVLCGLAVLFFILLYDAAGKWLSRCRNKTLRIICVGMSLLMLLLQGYFLFYVRSYYKWDSGFVIGAAASLAETGNVAEEAFYYMSVYPNQNTFVLLTAALVRLSNLLGLQAADRPLLFNLCNTVCMDAAMFMVIPLLKKWKKEQEDWKICRNYLLLLCNPFLYLGVSYYYTITLSLPFTMGFLLLLFSIRKEETWQKAWLKAALAGVLLGIGYEIRATAVILGIAVVLTGIWLLWNQEKKAAGRIAICMALLGLTALLSAGGLSRLQESYIGIDTQDTAFPTSHWLMMSLTMPGGHNAEDETYTASFPTAEEKKAAVAERMREKLEAMSLSDYLKLVGTKVRNTFGTGMNGYGTFLADALRTDGLYEVVFGGHKDFVILLHQGYWLFLLLGIMLSAGRWLYDCIGRHTADAGGFYLLLVLFGAILFYALWEASEQYSVPFMLLMSALALGGFEDAGEEILNRGLHTEKGVSFCAFAAAAVLALWGIFRFSKVTEMPMEQSHPVAVQILANTPYPVDDGQELVQTLHLTQPFNRLIIQWRNPSMEVSTAVYMVQLRETDGTVLLEEEIDAQGTGYNGTGIYDFETIVPGDSDYEIGMYKVAGEAEDDLEFVIYDMYGYTPYAAGTLSLQEKTSGEKEKMDASLLFAVSEECVESYADAKSYIIFIFLLFLIFLFMGFWCKLEVVANASGRNCRRQVL
jgi:hypothetical protein